MKNLRAITLRARELFQLLSHTSFPRLLDCTLPVSVDIFSFLRRNPAIASITMFPSPEEGPCPDFYASPIQSIHLPKLEDFFGPNIVACCVVPGSLVSRVGILWHENTVMDFSRDLAAVANSRSSINTLGGMICRWDPALLVAIAKYTPRIKYLQIRNIEDPSSPTLPKEDFLLVFDDTLRSLPCLAALAIVEQVTLRRPVHWVGDEFESEFAAVQRWGEISPTLVRITLSGARTWTRLAQGGWNAGDFVPF